MPRFLSRSGSKQFIWMLLTAVAPLGLAQQTTLSLGSASSVPGGSASLSLSLASSGTQPASLEWTLTYSPTDVSAVSVAVGSAASAAGKTVSCSSKTGSTICVLDGNNQNPIASGVVATVVATIVPGTIDTSSAVQLSGTGAVGATGSTMATSGTGGLITIAQSVPSISALSCSPASVTAPGSASCTVTLKSAALAGGSSVTLSSNDASVTVPASLNIATGATTGSFTATVAAAAASQTAVLTAASGGASQTFSLGVVAQGWSVSGTVTALGAGATVTLSGAANQVATANSSGSYTFTGVSNGAYTITPVKTGYTFSPSSQPVQVNGANLTANFTATQSPGAPATVTATAGTPQSATVSTAFATALQAAVKDSNGNLLSGVTVTFTAPTSGASATFSSGATATAVTNASGIAIAPTLTANAEAGSFTVDASVAGVAAPAAFSLSNTAPTMGGGTLTGSGTSATTPVNLTTEGTADWIHWGDSVLNRKASVTAQISNYTAVGPNQVFTYSNDPRPVSWTDGTPTAASSTNQNGIWISGLNQGYSFTAPADTSVRTLIVHVGGWDSGGTFTAHLSDGSAADFVDVTQPANGQFDRNYTLTYSAKSAGQNLTITWEQTSGAGNVTLSAAALAGPAASSGVPASITATAGTPQSASVNMAFATALQATVKDAGGNPVSGATVTFAAPASGASASFSSGSSATAVTNSNGIAAAPALTANAQTGSYTVTASVAGLSPQASFSLSNTAGSSVGTGLLTGSGNSLATAVNLTSEGAADWVHWGESSLNRKANVAAQISNYTLVGTGAVLTYNNDPRPMSWSDGSPTATSSSNEDGIYISGMGQGFSITAPADTTVRTLVVHVGGWNSGGTLTAHLSDGSAADFVDTTAAANGQFDRNYTLTYSAESAGQSLKVTWVMSSGESYGNVTLSAVSLAGPAVTTVPASISATAGTPQSVTVSTAFSTALQATVKDASGNPFSGATVTFTAPATGATASFSSGASATAVTNASGTATAPALTANAQAGSYAVTASVAGVSTPASFSLTNLSAGTGVGSLIGTGNSLNTAVNLTSEGTLDWVHWGDSSLNRKAGVTAQISNYTPIGGDQIFTYSNDPRPMSWTDGTPTASSASNQDGVFITGLGQGFSFTAPADPSVRTLVVHVGGWYSGGTLTAHLSDGSAADFVDVTQPANGQFDRNYTLTYSSKSSGQTLTITWVQTSGAGNVTLSGAAMN